MDAKTWEEVATFPQLAFVPTASGWGDDGKLWVSDTSAGVVMLMDTEKDGRIYDVFRVNEPEEVHGMTVRDNGKSGTVMQCPGK